MNTHMFSKLHLRIDYSSDFVKYSDAKSMTAYLIIQCDKPLLLAFVRGEFVSFFVTNAAHVDRIQLLLDYIRKFKLKSSEISATISKGSF
jgi:hypothetical protein